MYHNPHHRGWFFEDNALLLSHLDSPGTAEPQNQNTTSPLFYGPAGIGVVRWCIINGREKTKKFGTEREKAVSSRMIVNKKRHKKTTRKKTHAPDSSAYDLACISLFQKEKKKHSFPKTELGKKKRVHCIHIYPHAHHQLFRLAIEMYICDGEMDDF